MNEVERAKLVVKMDALEKEREGLYGQLNTMRDTHYYAASTYGSELSAGGMLNDEKHLQDKIDACSEEISVLRVAVQGQLDVSDAAADKLKQSVDGYAELVVQYGAERDRLQAELALVEKVRSYLK